MILERIKKSNCSPVAFIMDKSNGVQCIQKLNGSVFRLVQAITNRR